MGGFVASGEVLLQDGSSSRRSRRLFEASGFSKAVERGIAKFQPLNDQKQIADLIEQGIFGDREYASESLGLTRAGIGNEDKGNAISRVSRVIILVVSFPASFH